MGKILTDNHVNQFYKKFLDNLRNTEAVCYRYFEEMHSYRELYSAMLKFNAALFGSRNRQVVLYAGKSFHTYAAIYGILLSRNIWLLFKASIDSKRLVGRSSDPRAYGSFVGGRGTRLFSTPSMPLKIWEAI